MVQVQKGQGSDSFKAEIKLLRDDLLHAAEVGHGELALADADELMGRCHVALLLQLAGCYVKAAHSDAGQVLGLDLGERAKKVTGTFPSTLQVSSPTSLTQKRRIEQASRWYLQGLTKFFSK